MIHDSLFSHVRMQTPNFGIYLILHRIIPGKTKQT